MESIWEIKLRESMSAMRQIRIGARKRLRLPGSWMKQAAAMIILA